METETSLIGDIGTGRRRVGVYYAWHWPEEVGAPLGVIENRFPTLFETRRILYPRYLELADASSYDQGIAGFVDHILRRNFVSFVDTSSTATGRPTIDVERVTAGGLFTPLSSEFFSAIDTLVIISFDSMRTRQVAAAGEIDALRDFLSVPGNLAAIAPHHNLGDDPEPEFLHHGDRTIPPEQRFGGFSRSLLAELGVPVENRFGLHPAAEADGSPSPIVVDREADRLGLLDGVRTFNLHPHLPHLERIGDAVDKLDVVVRQRIDPNAPPHPFTADGRSSFDALLQSRSDVFAGTLIVADATLWSATAGGPESLERLWSNMIGRAV